jgi:hypothetical protein
MGGSEFFMTTHLKNHEMEKFMMLHGRLLQSFLLGTLFPLAIHVIHCLYATISPSTIHISASLAAFVGGKIDLEATSPIYAIPLGLQCCVRL